MQASSSKKCLKPALKFLNIDITGISTHDVNIIFILLLRWWYIKSTALKNNASMKHINKKYIHVFLILNGKIVSFPNYLSNMVKRKFYSFDVVK